MPSPFKGDAGEDADAVGPGDGAEGDVADAQDDADPTIGGPCLDDDQCDDALDCTFDRCDTTIERCRHVPDDLMCQDGRHCNGQEVCAPQRGCETGEPVTCSDTDPCTIDRCIEADQSCEHIARDADGDGDPDWHCGDGFDCNDNDPLVSSIAMEVCANNKDDDCDGSVDETDCGYPQNDTCADPLLIAPGQTVVVNNAGTKADYAASCIPSGSAGLRDVVAAITIPDDQPYDLDVLLQGEMGSVHAATAEQCGDPATELACGPGATGPLGSVARFIAREVPTGVLPIYLASDTEQQLSLRATLRSATAPPSNETCGTALEVIPGETVEAEIVGVDTDLASNCSAAMGDLVYRFETLEPHDLYVFAGSTDGLGDPIIGLRDEGCSEAENEIGCTFGKAPVLFERALPAGVYHVVVSSTTATTVQFRVELEEPTDPPEDEDCEGAPALIPNETVLVPLAGHVDDLVDTCLLGAVDAARTLELTEPSDVLLLGNLSTGDEGAVSLWNPLCDKGDMLTCGATTPSPVRTSIHNLVAGEYRAVIETRKGNPTRFTAFVRPSVPPTYVVFADTCDEAQAIGENGGFFQGNTSNASAQYGAGCDQAGGAPEGAPEQMLELQLTAPKRVVFDMRGSGYRTLLNVRRGPTCPGSEIAGACAVGFYNQRSFLDLNLEPGSYFVQVDGFFGESGAWFLDVFVIDP